MNRKKLNFCRCPAPGKHLAKYPARSSPTSSGLEKVKSSARCSSKNFRSPAAKASYDRCAKRRALIFGISLLSPVLRHPCFDQFFHQRQRQRVIGRKPNGAFGNLKSFQIAPKIFQRLGAAWIEGAMIRPCAEENQRTSIKAKRRNSIADALLRFRSDGTDCFPEFRQRPPLIRLRCREILVNRLWLSLR